MKLKVLDWKSAWFDNHISDRFFQEMSKLERGTVRTMDTTAHWMEQIMIEVGQLAQAMIRLESANAPEPQIHQAFEKALRLSALSLHLLTTLDGMDRERVRASHPFNHDLAAFLPPGNGSPAGTLPAPSAHPPGDTPARPPPPPAPPSRAPFLAGRPAIPIGKAPAASPAAPAQAAPGEAPQAAPDPDGTSSASSLTFSYKPLVEVSGKRTQQSGSRMRETILSLSGQGLSRAEIEVVTGEPRHIIEAVLDHDRAR
jgi:hypothetical protein